MKIAWSTKDVNMGEYILKYNAVASDGTTLQDEKTFMVGVLKGRLIKAEVKDARRGNHVKLSAQVDNIGNLKLPTTFSVMIMNKTGEKIFVDKKQVTISPGSTETIVIEWSTDEVILGTYTAEYSVQMGEDTLSDIISFKVLTPYRDYVIIASFIFSFVLIVYIILKKILIKQTVRNIKKY